MYQGNEIADISSKRQEPYDCPSLRSGVISNDSDVLLLLNLNKPYNFLKSFMAWTPSLEKTPECSPESSVDFLEELSVHCLLMFKDPLPSPSVCKAVITDFKARLGEFLFASISSPISAGLKLAPVRKISST
jgi:hypothetical protein